MKVIVLATFLALPVAAGYFLVVTDRRFVLHNLVIASFIVGAVGALLKILHWTGGEQIAMISSVGFAGGGLLLIWTALRNPTKQLLHYQLITGFLILLMELNTWIQFAELGNIIRFANYPLAALTATIILQETYVHEGEKNMLKMYFLAGIIAVLANLIELIL